MYSEKDYDGKKPSGLQLDFFRKTPKWYFPEVKVKKTPE